MSKTHDFLDKAQDSLKQDNKPLGFSFDFDFSTAEQKGITKGEIVSFLKQNATLPSEIQALNDEEAYNALKTQKFQATQDYETKFNDYFSKNSPIAKLQALKEKNEKVENENEKKSILDEIERIQKLDQTFLQKSYKDYNEEDINLYKSFLNYQTQTKNQNSQKLNKNLQDIINQNDLTSQQKEENFSELFDENEYEKFYKDLQENSLKRAFYSVKDSIESITGLGYSTDFQQKMNFELNSNINKKIQNGVKYEDLSNTEKTFLRNETFKKAADDLTSLHNIFDLSDKARAFKYFHKSSEEKAKIAFNERKQLNEAMMSNKSYDELSKDEKRLVDDFRGRVESVWDKTVGNNEEAFEELKQKYEASQIIAPQIQKQIAFLSNIHKHKSLSNQLIFKDEEAKKDYEGVIADLVEKIGFEGAFIDENTNKLYFRKDNKNYLVNEGFFDNFLNTLQANAGSIIGGFYGATKGFKEGKGIKGKLIKSSLGAAAGSFLGGAADVLIANHLLDRENSLKEIISHSTEEGLLSLAGDALILGAKPLINTLKTPIKKIGDLADYSPILGTFKNLPDQNFKAAEEIINKGYTETQKKEIFDTYAEFGGKIGINETKILQEQADLLSQKYGSDHFLAKGARVTSDFLNLSTLKEKQNNLISLIRADESGTSLAFILESAKNSPEVAKNLKNVLNVTTSKLKSSLDNLNLNKSDIKEVFNKLEKGTKQSYDEAINGVLTKIYDDTYKTKINPNNFQALVSKLKEENALLSESDKLINKNILNALFKSEGVTFSQLNNLNKNLNVYIKQISDPNLQDYLKSTLQNEIKTAIKTGINDIFSQNKSAYVKAKALYENAMSDYKDMKELLKEVDKLKVRDKAATEEKIVDNLLKFAKGQGDGDISNLVRLKKNLNEEDKAILEMNLLNRVFEKSLIENKTLNLSVFDSKAFLNELSKVSGSFESKEAKEFLELTQGFNKLFNQDAEIAKAFKQSLTQKEGANLATSLQGKAQMAIVKALWENVIRLMGKVPFATAWNEKVQGAALRYHIGHALKRAVSIDDFRNTLQNSLKQGKFNNKTKEIIKEFNESFESIKKENEALLKQSEEELVNKNIDMFKNNDKNNAFNALYYGANKKDYEAALKESERLKKEKEKQNSTTKQELESNKLFEEAMKTKQVPSGVQPKNMENKRDFIIETETLKSRDDFVEILENGDFIFKDKKGKKHILDTATQEQWLKTFDLINLSDEFTPQLKDELKAAIQKDIKVQVGSLYKLVSQGREEFIPQIKQVLEKPELALKDSENSLFLVKHIKDDDYFVNVSIDKNEDFISISKGIKEFNDIKNKLEAGAKVVYQSPNANSNLQTLLRDSLYSSNKIDKDIITNKESKSQAPQNFTYDTETLKKYREAYAKHSFSNLDEALKTKATIEEYKEYIKNAPDDFLKQQGFKIDKNEIIQRINEHLDDDLIGLNAKIEKLKKYNKFRESLKNQPELNEIQKLLDDYQAINGFNFGDRIHTVNKNPTLKELIYKAQGFKTASGKKVTLNELLKTGEAGEEAAWAIGEVVLGDTFFYYTLKSFMRSKEWATKNINDLSESEMKEKLGDMIMLKCLEKQKQGGLSQELALKEAKEELRREYETFMKERELTEFVEAKNATTNSANSAENQVKAFKFTTPKETSAYRLRKTLRDDLKPYVENHTPIINKTDGRVAFITQKGLGKLSSSKASEKSIQNGFSEAQHFEVVKNLKELYENAKFSDTMADKNGAKNLQIHHYTADFILDGESAQAKIMLKETIDGQNKGNRIYTLELESVARLKPAEPQAPATASVKPQNSTTSPAVSTHSTNAEEILAQNAKQSQATNSQVTKEPKASKK